MECNRIESIKRAIMSECSYRFIAWATRFSTSPSDGVILPTSTPRANTQPIRSTSICLMRSQPITSATFWSRGWSRWRVLLIPLWKLCSAWIKHPIIKHVLAVRLVFWNRNLFLWTVASTDASLTMVWCFSKKKRRSIEGALPSFDWWLFFIAPISGWI